MKNGKTKHSVSVRNQFNLCLVLFNFIHSILLWICSQTMFELISGYGVWHRRYFVLEGCNMCYWNHPNDKETKVSKEPGSCVQMQTSCRSQQVWLTSPVWTSQEAEGSISLSSSTRQCVRPVKRDSCARPFTFELVSNIPHQQDNDSQEALTK